MSKRCNYIKFCLHFVITFFISRALGKLGNIVAETICFLYQCFPVCPPRETLLRKQAKMFPNIVETMFPSLPTFSNVSSTRNMIFPD